MTNAYVTSFNHASLAGVEEIAELLTGEFARCGFNVMSCRALPENLEVGDVVIVIDEFSEPLIIENLQMFRAAHPEAKLVCVLTEFFTAGNLARPSSLNSFKQPQQSLLFDNLLYVYCFLSGYLKLFPNLQIKAPGFLNYLLSIFGLVWLALQKAWRPKTPIRRLRTFHERAYLWFRVLGLQSVPGIFDYYLALHPDIANQALATALGTDPEKIHTLLVPPPAVDKSNLVNSKLEFGIDLSGSVTRYRRRQLRRAIRLMQRLSPGGRFTHSLKRGFNDSKKKFLLSFNPPQSNTWCYSSPMRIIGAIKRGQIPVVSEKFGDHPAEDLALMFPSKVDEARNFVKSLAFEPSGYIDQAWDKLQHYRELVDKNNRAVIRQLRKDRNCS